MTDVQAILREPDRRWRGVAGADLESLERLKSAAREDLPSELTDLLLASNGGEGDLGLPPLYFMLYPVEFILEILKDPSEQELYPHLLSFGSNGGLERLALDLRRGNPPWPVVMFDPIAGAESMEEVATDFASFALAIGRTYSDVE